MKEIYDILSEFKTLKEYSDFMSTLVEKSASGHEISRGKSQHDKSKDQKDQQSTYLSKTVSKKADGSAEEQHYDQVDPSIGAGEPPPPPVPLQPGQQVTIGNKKLDKGKTAPSTVSIELSGETDKLEMKPRINKNPDNLNRQ